jgi:hypothetical protein
MALLNDFEWDNFSFLLAPAPEDAGVIMGEYKALMDLLGIGGAWNASQVRNLAFFWVDGSLTFRIAA